MTVSLKYSLYLTLFSILEIILLFTSKEHFVVYSSGVFLLLTFGLGLVRIIYIDLKIYKYLRDKHPEVYTKLVSSLFGIKLIPRSALSFKFVLESLDSTSLQYHKEYKVLLKHIFFSFFLFGIFSFIIVLSAHPI